MLDPERAITGPARLGKRTKDLVKRLELGEIAVIDHADLDRIAAEDLVASGVPAVINVASFSTDRYPNIGPLILARAGVVLVEAAGAPLFDEVDDGQVLSSTAARSAAAARCSRGARGRRWRSSTLAWWSSAAGSTRRSATSP